MRSGVRENAISLDVFSEKRRTRAHGIHCEREKENRTRRQLNVIEMNEEKKVRIENWARELGAKRYRFSIDCAHLHIQRRNSAQWWPIFSRRTSIVNRLAFGVRVCVPPFFIFGSDPQSMPFPFVWCPQHLFARSLSIVWPLLRLRGQMLIINSKNYERSIGANGVALLRCSHSNLRQPRHSIIQQQMASHQRQYRRA